MWLTQCPVITCNGKESEMEHTHAHTQEASLVAQMVTNLPVMQESQV